MALARSRYVESSRNDVEDAVNSLCEPECLDRAPLESARLAVTLAYRAELLQNEPNHLLEAQYKDECDGISASTAKFLLPRAVTALARCCYDLQMAVDDNDSRREQGYFPSSATTTTNNNNNTTTTADREQLSKRATLFSLESGGIWAPYGCTADGNESAFDPLLDVLRTLDGKHRNFHLHKESVKFLLKHAPNIELPQGLKDSYCGLICGESLTSHGSDACFSSEKGDSSTLVRLLLDEGRVAEACRLSSQLLTNATNQLQQSNNNNNSMGYMGELEEKTQNDFNSNSNSNSNSKGGLKGKRMSQWTPYNLLDKLIITSKSTILQFGDVGMGGVGGMHLQEKRELDELKDSLKSLEGSLEKHFEMLANNALED